MDGTASSGRDLSAELFPPTTDAASQSASGGTDLSGLLFPQTQTQNGNWGNLPPTAQIVGNLATGIINADVGIPAIPDTLARLGDKTVQYVQNKARDLDETPEVPYTPSPLVQMADKYLPTQEGMENLVYPALGVPNYIPQSTAGRIAQNVAGLAGTLRIVA
jgi:hypothetical protein